MDGFFLLINKLKQKYWKQRKLKKLKKNYTESELKSLVKLALSNTSELVNTEEKWIGEHLDCIFYSVNESELNSWFKKNL